jgi:hypothetical protein
MDANLVSLGVSYIYFRRAKYVLRLKKVGATRAHKILYQTSELLCQYCNLK